MPQRRANGRAVVLRKAKAKPAPTKVLRRKSQSSTGSNAAAAHGYSQKGPTRKLKPAAQASVKAPQSLTRAAALDRSQEAQKGSPAQRGAVLRRSAAQTDAARIRANVEAQHRTGGGGVLRAVKHAGEVLAKTGVEAASRTAGPGVKAAVDLVGSNKPQSVERELHGAGEFAKATKDAAEFVGKHGRIISTGAGGGVAGAALTRKAKKQGGGTVVATAVPRPVKPPKLVVNAAEDLINAPAQAIPSVIVPGEAAVKAARGDSRPLKKYLKDAKDTDPVVNAVTGHFGKALKLAEEHPGFTALEVAGTAGTLGRGVSRGARGTGKVLKAAGAEGAGEKLRRVGATETRPDATVPGTNLRESRHYGRGAQTKAAQIAKDNVQAKRAVKLRKRADQAEATDTEHAQTLRRRANDADPAIMTPRQVKARVDLQEAAGEARRRREVGDVDDRVRKIVKRTGDDGAALNLVTQGITKASVQDLKAYRDELARAHDTLADAGKKQANRRLRELIDHSISRAENGRIRKLDLERVKEAATEFSQSVDRPLDKELVDLGLIPTERAVRAKLIPAAARQGAKVDPEMGIVDAAGRPLSTQALKDIAADRDAPVSYVSQAPNARGAGAYYRSSAREPTIGSRQRTERPTIEGTFDAHPETLRARAMKAKNIAVAARNFRDNLAEVAVRREDTGKPQLYTRSRAEKTARSLQADTGIEFTPVAFEPWGVTHEQRAAMQEAMGDLESPRAEVSLRDSMKRALAGEGDQGRFVLVPRAAARRMEEHLGMLDPTDAGKIMQAARGAFSKTVLSTSPSPVIGNIVEGGFRMGMARSGPRSALTTRKVLRAMDPEARAKLEDRVFTGGRVTLSTTSRHFDPQQLSEGTVRQMSARFQAVKRAGIGPKGAVGPNGLASAWNAWTHFVNGYVNGKLERGAQHAMLGKAIRDSGLMGDRIVKLSRVATQQAAEGLVGTAEQAAMAREVTRMYGQYSGFSPGKRKIIAQYTPFAAWWLSSVRFLGRMPLDHPTATALAAANERATAEWRQVHGNNLFGPGRLPNWLQGTVESKAGRIQVTRNTPFGAFTDPLGAVGGLWMPQLQSLINGANGQDWKGTKLRNADGTDYDPLQQGRYILGVLAESTIPAYAAPAKVIGYAKDPGKLLNAVRVRSKTPTSTRVITLPPGATLPAGKAGTLPPSSAKLPGDQNFGGDDLNFDTDSSFDTAPQNFGG